MFQKPAGTDSVDRPFEILPLFNKAVHQELQELMH